MTRQPVSLPLTDQRKTSMVDALSQTNAQLAAIGDSTRSRMPERIFVGIWVPFFADEPNRAYKVGVEEWVNFAGSPYRSVDVIDASGVVLFTVPPLMDNRAIDPVAISKAAPISHVVTSASQYARLTPAMGENYLDEELTKRALVMNVPVSVLEHLTTWNEIFKRYGRAPLIDVASPKAAADPAAPSTPEGPDYEFELL